MAGSCHSQLSQLVLMPKAQRLRHFPRPAGNYMRPARPIGRKVRPPRPTTPRQCCKNANLALAKASASIGKKHRSMCELRKRKVGRAATRTAAAVKPTLSNRWWDGPGSALLCCLVPPPLLSHQLTSSPPLDCHIPVDTGKWWRITTFWSVQRRLTKSALNPGLPFKSLL